MATPERAYFLRQSAGINPHRERSAFRLKITQSRIAKPPKSLASGKGSLPG